MRYKHFNLERVSVFMMEDRLAEISIDGLKRLRDLYNPDGIKSYTTFVTIDTYLRWNEQNPRSKDENIKFYCLNGNISDGTFLVIVSLFF